MVDDSIIKVVVQYSLNPNIRPVRKEIFGFLVLKAISKQPKGLTLNEIRSSIRDFYKIDMPILILKQTLKNMIDLNKIDYDSGPKIYNINQTSKSDLRKYETKFNEKYMNISNWFFDRVYANYKKDINFDHENDLLYEFIMNCNRIIDIRTEEALFHDVSDRAAVGGIRCNIKYLDPDLRDVVDKIYKDLTLESIKELRELINLRVFWNVFTSILPYRSDVNNFLDNKMKEMNLILDTNVLISLSAKADRYSYLVNKYIPYLLDTGIRMYYSEKTIREFEERLSRVRNAAYILDHYPNPRMKNIAKKTLDPILLSYYEGGFLRYDDFYRMMIKSIEDFGLIKIDDDFLKVQCNISKDQVESYAKEIEPLLVKYFEKSEYLAEHDAYLLSLVHNLREKHFGWYVDWILTLDNKLRYKDKRITGKSAPMCIHVEHVPRMFYPYTLAKSITLNTNNINECDIYKSLLEVSSLVADSDSTKKAIKNFEQIDDIEDQFVHYLQQICWEEEPYG